MHGDHLIILSGIVFAGFACQWIAWRVKLPSILFLLLVGIVAGPLTGLLDPDAVFGDLLEPVVSLAVAVILYEGSMTLKFAEIRGRGAVVRNLVTGGVLITWVIAMLSAHYFLGWDIYLAALFGAIVTVSGPTVILPLLRSIRPNANLSSIIKWEGILVDPLGAIFAVLVFDFIIATQTAGTPEHLFGTFALIVGIGVGLGVIAGHAFGIALRRHWLPDYLRDYAALALVILVFGIAESIETESGLLAVTIMGVWQANMRDLDLEDILGFKKSLTLVLVAGLFIILAARVNLEGLINLGAGALAVLLTLQFFGGPLRAMACATGSSLTFKERLLLGWLFPRGIVAAAVSALFALRLESRDYPGAEFLVPMVFVIIVGTVVVQSLTGGVLARWLKVSDPDPDGVLVIGANDVALAFANALRESGKRVVVASMDWDGVKAARMAGLKVFYGSPVSAYAERHLDLIGLGYLLALSHRPGLNELACLRYRHEFGRDAVFTLPQKPEKTHAKHQISGEKGGRILFADSKSMQELADIIAAGVEARTTEITDSFTFADYKKEHPDGLVLFSIDANGKLGFPIEPDGLEVGSGSKVTALIPDEVAERGKAGA